MKKVKGSKVLKNGVEEAKNEAKRNGKRDKTSKQEHRPDFVDDSRQRSSLTSEKDDNNWNNATDNKGNAAPFII
ncbi:unnamed protein product [Lupinus luteus]|uniref:Uncharacterized protein n=1 Tax=Lupinus luteus TaxID=3873 RepID=A0AAV1XES7_LUPLU